MATSIPGKPSSSAVRPSGSAWLAPYLCVSDPRAAIEFFTTVFGFETIDCAREDGAIVHAELRYQGERVLMLAPQGAYGSTARTPRHAGSVAPQTFYLYVADVDQTYQRALEAGGKSLIAPFDAFWGDRFAQIEDLDGYRWGIAGAAESSART